MIRRLVLLSAAAGLAAAACAAAAADAPVDFPTRPIKIVVPYPPGGSTDTLARTLGARISQRLGQPVVVENRAGASGNIGAVYAASQPPDGYTVFLGTSTALAVNPSLFKSLPYDPQRDFTPIVLATTLPNIVVVNSTVPAKTLAELVTYMRSRPGKETYASAGNGTPSHLGGEVFKKAANIDVAHVPYKGGAPALTDLASGQTSYMIAVLAEAMPFVKMGKLRALATTTLARLPNHPDLPTVAEEGMPGFELIAWYGLLAPAKTPPAIVARLNKAFDEALQDKEIAARLSDAGFIIEGGPPARLTEIMRSETAKWKKVIDESNIKPD